MAFAQNSSRLAVLGLARAVPLRLCSGGGVDVDIDVIGIILYWVDVDRYVCDVDVYICPGLNIQERRRRLCG